MSATLWTHYAGELASELHRLRFEQNIAQEVREDVGDDVNRELNFDSDGSADSFVNKVVTSQRIGEFIEQRCTSAMKKLGIMDGLSRPVTEKQEDPPTESTLVKKDLVQTQKLDESMEVQGEADSKDQPGVSVLKILDDALDGLEQRDDTEWFKYDSEKAEWHSRTKRTIFIKTEGVLNLVDIVNQLLGLPGNLSCIVWYMGKLALSNMKSGCISLSFNWIHRLDETDPKRDAVQKGLTDNSQVLLGKIVGIFSNWALKSKELSLGEPEVTSSTKESKVEESKDNHPQMPAPNSRPADNSRSGGSKGPNSRSGSQNRTKSARERSKRRKKQKAKRERKKAEKAKQTHDTAQQSKVVKSESIHTVKVKGEDVQMVTVTYEDGSVSVRPKD